MLLGLYFAAIVRDICLLTGVGHWFYIAITAPKPTVRAPLLVCSYKLLLKLAERVLTSQVRTGRKDTQGNPALNVPRAGGLLTTDRDNKHRSTFLGEGSSPYAG